MAQRHRRVARKTVRNEKFLIIDRIKIANEEQGTRVPEDAREENIICKLPKGDRNKSNEHNIKERKEKLIKPSFQAFICN
jgi:hypothetical protein